MDEDLERVLDAFDAPEPSRDGHPPKLAAVLLAVYRGSDGPELLYIKRTETMREHPGEVSFPGGRVELGESPRDAALREAEEEVGIRAADLLRVTHVVDHVTYRGSTVCAYVARSAVPPPREPTSVDEVAAVFTVPVRRLLDPDGYEARRVDGMGEGRRVHYWHVAPQTIWGITGEVTAQFLARAYGWTPPGRPRTVTDIADLIPRS